MPFYSYFLHVFKKEYEILNISAIIYVNLHNLVHNMKTLGTWNYVDNYVDYVYVCVYVYDICIYLYYIYKGTFQTGKVTFDSILL